jgi:nicotinate-nucleotide adenylyltransferase
MKKKLGLFGGTFDPIHFGHLNLALELLEKEGLDEVLFCPARTSPFKKTHPPLASPEDRLAMVKLAIEGISAFRLSTLELARSGPSYTIDTLRALRAPDVQLYLLLSSDALEDFHLWKEADEILELSRPLIGARTGFLSPQKIPEALQKGIISTRALDISSTEVRDRLKKRLYCGHLLPAKVLDYIQKHHLYS